MNRSPEGDIHSPPQRGVHAFRIGSGPGTYFFGDPDSAPKLVKIRTFPLGLKVLQKPGSVMLEKHA